MGRQSGACAVLVCGAALVALAACGKKDAAGGAPAAGEAAQPAVASAPAAPPSRKAGLWEQTMTMAMGGEAARRINQATQVCVDEASEARMKWWATEARHGDTECSEQAISPTLGGWKFHSVCKMGQGMTVTSDGQATGDFGSHYKVDVTSVTSGSSMAQANGTHKIAIEATYKGPCPAGMKPGDIAMPGGMKINMNDAVSGGMPGGLKPGERPTRAQMEQMRAQAMEMAKKYKEGAQ